MSLVGNLLKPVGSAITKAGTALNLPDLGIGKALGDQQALPGALQGTNPLTYQGIQGVSTDTRFGQPLSSQQVGQLGQTLPSDQGGGQGIYGGSAAGGSAGSSLSPYLSLINGDTATLNSLYDAVNGGVTNYAQQARGTVDSSLANTLKQNDNSLKSNINQATGAYGSRGTLDSSDYGNYLTGANNDYTSANKSAQDQANSNYAQIGQTIGGVQQQLAAKPQYDLSQFTDPTSLMDLHNQLGQYIASLQQSQQSLTPQGDLVSKLNSIAPVSSNLSQTLTAKLQNLVNSGADPAAANILAKGYLSQAGVDPNDPTWNNYFQSLIGQKSATAAGGNAAPAVTLTPDELSKTLIGAS